MPSRREAHGLRSSRVLVDLWAHVAERSVGDEDRGLLRLPQVGHRRLDRGDQTDDGDVEDAANRRSVALGVIPYYNLLVPEISRFFGIIVAMFYDEHAPPHFHVRYGSQSATIAIDDLRLLSGALSPRARGLVVEWASAHQDELARDWELARAKAPLQAIAPLE